MPKAPKKPSPRIELYADAGGNGWRYRAIARNGREDGASEEPKTKRYLVARQAARRYPDRTIIVVNADGTWQAYRS